MTLIRRAWWLVAVVPLLLVGCQKPVPGESAAAADQKAAANKKGDQRPGPVVPSDSEADEAEIRDNLAKLSPEDRKVAEEQKACPITGESLGSMGVPYKLTLKGQTVFLCCKGCRKDAEKDPDKTLAKLKELKEKAGK